MADFCCNTVRFAGNITNMQELQELFAAMAEKETETQQGQLPPFVEATEGYMFQTALEDGCCSIKLNGHPTLRSSNK